MKTPSTYTKSGTKASVAAKLDAGVFGVTVDNHTLLKDAYIAYLANGRSNYAVTKTRGEVRGGGKKPWKQKGTGRARFGSSRVPIWRGGGITFGPTGLENYTKKINVKAKRLALRQALSLQLEDNKLAIVETFDASGGKVKNTVALLDKVAPKGNALLVVANKSDMIDRATSNIDRLKVVSANYLNIFDLMNADTIVFEKASIEVVQQWLGAKEASA